MLCKEWSAPCAITWENNTHSAIQAGQETILLFMTEHSIVALVTRSPMILGQSHRFLPGPLYGTRLNLDSAIDVYAYVRYNNGFTPPELISQHMAGWSVREDSMRHGRWHGKEATWFDVLTNKISVDRSSVGNALYLVLNMAAGNQAGSSNNYAHIEHLAGIAPSVTQQPNAIQPNAIQQNPIQQNPIQQNASQQQAGMYFQQQPTAQMNQALYNQMMMDQQKLLLLQQQQLQQQQYTVNPGMPAYSQGIMSAQQTTVPAYAQSMYNMNAASNNGVLQQPPQQQMMGYGQLNHNQFPQNNTQGYPNMNQMNGNQFHSGYGS